MTNVLTLFLLLVVAAPPTVLPAATPQIAFGGKHAVALRDNGDVLTWGDNVGCELGRATKANADPAPVLVMRNAVEIAAASEHTIVLTRDGRVYGWGNNAEGVLGLGHTHDACEGPALVAALVGKTIVHVATGYGFSVAVTKEGDLLCTGDNSFGQCPGSKAFRLELFTPIAVPELAGNVASVAAGAFHTLVLTRDGKMYAFGRGRDGQLGNGQTANGVSVVPEMTHVVSMAAGTWHSVAVKDDGSVWAWGSNIKSQLCDGTVTPRVAPTRIESVSVPIVRVAAGGHSTMLAARDGAVYVCGDNQARLLGVEQTPTVPWAVRVAAATTRGPVFAVGTNNAVFGVDNCGLRFSGYNDYAVVSRTGHAAAMFTAKSDVSLCGAAGPAPTAGGAAVGGASPPNVVHEAPHGGASGCWAPRREEDAAANPKWAGLRQAMLSAEAIVKADAAFLAAPEPIRLRTTLAAGPYAESGARMHIKAVAERKNDGTRVWGEGCDVIPQLDRIGGAIAQVAIFFNPDPRMFFGAGGAAPKQTGMVGRYPEYDGWVFLTRDGRLPWIAKVAGDGGASVAPGLAKASGLTPDPSFPDFREPNRIQVIAVSFSRDPDPQRTERRAWQQRAKDALDWDALAALLK